MYKFLPLLLLQSCMYGGGVAVRPTSLDNQHLDNMSNPVGVIRVQQDYGKTQVYYEHLSSIIDGGEDYGINPFGLIYVLGN